MRRRQHPPSTPVEYFRDRVRDYLHLPDPGALYLVVSTVAANLIEGYPVWLMLVGPPSSGKSALLNALKTIPHVFSMANISGESAFLSATPERDRSDRSTGGVLRQVGAHGGIIIDDFTNVLSLRQDTQERIMSVFRETYGGTWTRDVGAEGGLQLAWKGRVAFMGGVTGVIDRHHQISAALGERWIYCRMEHEDGFEKAMQALENRTGWQEDLAALFRAFFEGLDLEFGRLQPRRALANHEKVRLIRLASVASRCRSSVPRDQYTKEVIDGRETEYEMRLAVVLGQLLVGMEYIGVPEPERWRLLQKVALDSMPKLRRSVLEAVARSSEPLLISDLRCSVGAGVGAINRAAEDLEIHGILAREHGDARTRFLLTDWAREEIKKGWGKL